MKRFPFWIAIVGLGAGTAAHAATGTLSMSWDVCAPVVTHKVNSTAPASLIFSVLGCDETHIAYQVRFLLTDANETTPDAWRFDAGGCQTNQLIQIRSDPPRRWSRPARRSRARTDSRSRTSPRSLRRIPSPITRPRCAACWP